jgi:hypothetical protein
MSSFTEENRTGLSLEITGLFEIHITVEESSMYKFRIFCMQNKLKPIYAIAENMKPQLMFSKYKNGTIQETIDKANSLKDSLIANGIKVLRVKVESMGLNKGVPEKENNLCTSNNYFEYHIKFPVIDSDEYYDLLDIVKSYIMKLPVNPLNTYSPTVFCSFNSLKKEVVPLVTLRVDGSWGSEIANLCKDDLMSFIKSYNFHTNEGIQFEFAVYDTYKQLDSE